MDGIKQCKCANCDQLFRPDSRNAWHQRYCGASACRAASKAASQRRWLGKPENRDYFRGPEQVERVREWRKAHPGYSQRTKASTAPNAPATAAAPTAPARGDAPTAPTVPSAASAPAVPAVPAAPVVAPLQDVVPIQVFDAQRQSGLKVGAESSAPRALQELLQQQPVVLIGLLAHLSASTLQDDIALAGQRLLQLGQDVLGCGVRA